MKVRLSRVAGSVARLLRGWRAVALLAVVAGAFGITLITSDGTVSIALSSALITVLILSGVVSLIALEADRTASWAKRQSELTTKAIRQSARQVEASARMVEAASYRARLFDLVLADATRSLSEPTTFPWPDNDPSRPVLLLPGAAYHLAEIIPLQVELEHRGIATRIAVGEAHWPRVRQGLVGYSGAVHLLPSPELATSDVSALLTMKDWAGYRPYVEAAQAHDIPTFAKVEGAQDFDEVDTGRGFRPYRTADHILCQGTNDHSALPGSRSVVGSTRLERLWRSPVRTPRRVMAVINLNFSYGVLTEASDVFLETAVSACVATGTPYVVAIHPAVRSRRSDPAFTTIPISRLLEHASLLISRFSTVPFEAMARGVPFVYHNPHSEKVPTFHEPSGAFDVSHDAESLADAIEESAKWVSDYRDRARGFFLRQVDVDPGRPSELRSADVIAASLD